MNVALPSPAHHAFSRLLALGRLAGVIAACVASWGCAQSVAQSNAPNAPAEPEPALPSSVQVPVGQSDVLWGNVNAPVTIVAFLDFECPFCARVHPTLVELLEHYGPEKLRLVVKHAPLPFHERAIPAARVAQAVYRLEGSAAFMEFIGDLFETAASEGADGLSSDKLAAFAASVGVERSALDKESSSAQVTQKVADDTALYERLGMQGVPGFLVNGAALTGARPVSDFETLIEHELTAAAELVRRGVASADVYERRVQVNFRMPQGNDDAEEPPFEDVAYRVPIGNSPSQGPANAAVTIVEFADFECPFCQRSHETVKQLMANHPGQIRWVMKHNPLAFHAMAIPAAVTALEIHRQKGDAAYWKALELFFAAPELTPDAVLGVADQLGVDSKALLQKFESETIPEQLQADQDLASDLEAQGTPQFFVNGRRLSGAQPLEVFEQLVAQELERAKTVATGSADVYATLQSHALPPPGLLRRDVPPPPPDAPTLGPSDAPVTIEMFADFECPYCQRVLPTLATLRARYPGKIRIVWRNLPLPFHAHSRQAASAALEARAQRGPEAFWAMAERLMALPGVFLGTAVPETIPPLPNLTLEFLTQQAQAAGLNGEQFAAAMKGSAHAEVIAGDERAARQLGVTGTPSFFVNGYSLSGAQPLQRFERLVRLAIEEQERTSVVSSAARAPSFKRP